MIKYEVTGFQGETHFWMLVFDQYMALLFQVVFCVDQFFF